MSAAHSNRFSTGDPRDTRARDRSMTDLQRVRGMSDEEVERNAADDLQEQGIPADWYLRAKPVNPKVPISIRLDADVLEYFKAQGPGWQTRMNSVLRAYMEAVPLKK